MIRNKWELIGESTDFCLVPGTLEFLHIVHLVTQICSVSQYKSLWWTPRGRRQCMDKGKEVRRIVVTISIRNKNRIRISDTTKIIQKIRIEIFFKYKIKFRVYYDY